MGNYDAVQDVRRALSRRMETGSSDSIVDVLEPYSRADWEYWSKVADELHTYGAHYDALDA